MRARHGFFAHANVNAVQTVPFWLVAFQPVGPSAVTRKAKATLVSGGVSRPWRPWLSMTMLVPKRRGLRLPMVSHAQPALQVALHAEPSRTRMTEKPSARVGTAAVSAVSTITKPAAAIQRLRWCITTLPC